MTTEELAGMPADRQREHRAYLDGLGGEMAEPDMFLRENATATCRHFGGGPACAFELPPM